jgi:hypothetical protein
MVGLFAQTRERSSARHCPKYGNDLVIRIRKQFVPAAKASPHSRHAQLKGERLKVPNRAKERESIPVL